MKNIVISGGTDGIDKALALTYLIRGDNTIVIGRNKEKGKAFIEAANEIDADTRAYFIQADLSCQREQEGYQGDQVKILCGGRARTVRSALSYDTVGISVEHKSFDKDAAKRLYDVTRELLSH